MHVADFFRRGKLHRDPRITRSRCLLSLRQGDCFHKPFALWRHFRTWDQAQFQPFSYILSYGLPVKLGLIQSLTGLCSLQPDSGLNADWLLEQCHRTFIQYLFPVCSRSRPCLCRLSRSSCSDAVGSSLVGSILLYGLPVRAWQRGIEHFQTM